VWPPHYEGATRTPRETLDYILYFVPGSRDDFPVFGPVVNAQIDAETGSPFKMIFAAAPVPPVTLPVRLTRVVPAAHFPFVARSLNDTRVTVVPLPPFQVNDPDSVPDFEPLGGCLNWEVAPALSATGVQFEIVDGVVLPDFGTASVAQAKCGVRAADAGAASATLTVSAAVAASAIPRARTDRVMDFPL
jgi:hypothetical protein